MSFCLVYSAHILLIFPTVCALPIWLMSFWWASACCHFAEWPNVDCHSAECHFTQCRATIFTLLSIGLPSVINPHASSVVITFKPEFPSMAAALPPALPMTRRTLMLKFVRKAAGWQATLFWPLSGTSFWDRWGTRFFSFLLKIHFKLIVF